MNLRLWRHYQKNQAILKTQVTKIKLVIVIMIKDTSYPQTLIVN